MNQEGKTGRSGDREIGTRDSPVLPISLFIPLLLAAVANVANADSALSVRVFDGNGAELTGDAVCASVERTPPARCSSDLTAADGDPDALRFVLIGPRGALPLSVALRSFSKSAHQVLDSVDIVPLKSIACPAGTSSDHDCASTLPIRAVTDDLDRSHPLVKDRSLKVELGGTFIVATPTGNVLATVPVTVPRELDVDRQASLSATLRVRLLRIEPGGAPPIGTDASDAIARVRNEIARTAGAWSQCGIDLGDVNGVDVKVVDPPPPHLLAVGCDAALPASGGFFVFNADGQRIEVKVPAGTSPRGASRLAAIALKKAGFTAVVFDGSPGNAAPYGPSDISVRRRNGDLAILATARDPAPDGIAPQQGHASTDATLDACIGSVSPDNGLDHFTDSNSVQGSIEERTLIRAFDDGDPRTVDVYVVPSFGGSNRIGESFIAVDHGSIRNVVIEDRAGFRAGHASLTLAHELGHVLMSDPGHPDDFGTDTPTRLMDADAVDGTAFGPRRLTIVECIRAVRESGPKADVPILSTANAAKRR
jgi:hypothetical protein